MAVTMKAERAKALAEGQLPDELGLIPDTFIMPRGKNRPSWFKDYQGRMRLERKRLRVRLTDFWSAFMYRYWMVRPRPRLRIFDIPAVAKDLHKEMYEHFAAGQLQPVEAKICEGLLSSLRSRISQRPANTRLRWTLHKYLSRPRVVSYKAVPIPDKNTPSTQRNGMVQAVVRLHSLQSLQHVKRVAVRHPSKASVTKEVLVDSQGRELPDSAAENAEEAARKSAKELVEYLVIQKSLRKSKEGPWMIWGTAEETTSDKLAPVERKK